MIANAGKRLHGACPPVLIPAGAPPDGLVDRFGDSRVRASRTRVERGPGNVVEMKVNPPHGIYGTTPRPNWLARIRMRSIPTCLRYHRDVARFERITANPSVMGGKPCIRGMRVTVGMIVAAMAAGRTVEQLLADFPYLEEPDIREALALAARPVQRREIEARPPAARDNPGQQGVRPVRRT